jgi:hypothetical protein
MKNHFLIKYKDEKGGLQTFVTQESSYITTQQLCDELKVELQKRGIEYPTFAIEQINEATYNHLKRKGRFCL